MISLAFQSLGFDFCDTNQKSFVLGFATHFGIWPKELRLSRLFTSPFGELNFSQDGLDFLAMHPQPLGHCAL